MKSTLKVKTAGAGAKPSPDTTDTPADVMRPIDDARVVYNGEPEATPPDIIVE